jgi:hypothetical protein
VIQTAALLMLLLCAPATTQTSADPPGGRVTPPARRDVPGKRVELAAGEFYVPDFYVSGDKVDVVIWFHGAAWVVQQEFYAARKNAALFVASPATVKAGFRQSSQFQELLNEIEQVAGNPMGRICLGSFSGGYTAVGDILQLEEFQDRISDVVLADSLYAPRKKDDPGKLDDAAMAPFLEYARRAADAKCTFWFSQLYPPEQQHRSNTTTFTAAYLIDRIGAERIDTSTTNARGMKLLYRADKGNFHVLGYAGMTNQDHFDHLYHVSDLLRQTSLLTVPQVEQKR